MFLLPGTKKWGGININVKNILKKAEIKKEKAKYVFIIHSKIHFFSFI